MIGNLCYGNGMAKALNNARTLGKLLCKAHLLAIDKVKVASYINMEMYKIIKLK